MPNIGLSPLVVPYGADHTIYLVADCISAGEAGRETETERSDLDALITDLLAGKFGAPVRVIAFNTLEHWRRDISKEVAEEIRERCDIDGISVPEYLGDFVERQRAHAPQPDLWA